MGASEGKGRCPEGRQWATNRQWGTFCTFRHPPSSDTPITHAPTASVDTPIEGLRLVQRLIDNPSFGGAYRSLTPRGKGTGGAAAEAEE
eukprot:607456-Pyramimonas_sp.AAC.1